VLVTWPLQTTVFVLRPVARPYGQVCMLWNQCIVIDCSLSRPAGHKPFTLRLYVSCDLTVMPSAGCVFLLAFLHVYLRPRRVLHGPFPSSVASELLSDWPIDCFL